MQPALQFAVSSQLDEHHLVEGEAHKVKRLRDRSSSSVVDICHDLLRIAVAANDVVEVVWDVALLWLEFVFGGFGARTTPRFSLNTVTDFSRSARRWRGVFTPHLTTRCYIIQ